jgi:hypothetical protein
MSRSDSVDVFVRLRPSEYPTGELRVSGDSRSIGVKLSKQPGHGVPGGVNNQPDAWGPFAMEGVLDARASQETVYEDVAADVIEHVLQGYVSSASGAMHNTCPARAVTVGSRQLTSLLLSFSVRLHQNGTIMAYGQTGAGFVAAHTTRS